MGGGGAFLCLLEEVVAEVVWSRFSLWPFNSHPVSLATPVLFASSDTLCCKPRLLTNWTANHESIPSTRFKVKGETFID